MTHRGPERRTPARWLADDLKGMNRPRTIVPTLRNHPVILLQGLIYAVLAGGVLALFLLAFGNLQAFGEYVEFPIVGTGLFIGARIHGYQDRPIGDAEAD